MLTAQSTGKIALLAKEQRAGGRESSRNSNKAQGTLTTNVQLSEPKGSRACKNLKNPSYSAGRGLQCHVMLLMRTVFFTDASCWTEARSTCSKRTLPGSANVPIKPLFGLIPSAKPSGFFFPDSRKQMLRGWHPIQNPSTWSAPGIIRVTVLQTGLPTCGVLGKLQHLKGQVY